MDLARQVKVTVPNYSKVAQIQVLTDVTMACVLLKKMNA